MCAPSRRQVYSCSRSDDDDAPFSSCTCTTGVDLAFFLRTNELKRARIREAAEAGVDLRVTGGGTTIPGANG